MVLQFYIPTHKCEGWEKINNLLLKGCPHILGMIWRDVKRYWLAQIKLPSWNELIPDQSEVEPGQT